MKIFLFLLLLTGAAFAEDFTYDPATGTASPKHVGELKILKGQAFKLVGEREAPVKIGTKFYQNDVLTTGEKSFVQVVIFDETKLNLGPNSSVKFEHFKFKSPEEREAVYHFLKGQLRALIKKTAKPGDIKFRTSVATMGVRGTELLVNHQHLNGVDVSQFALVQGKVEVTNFKGEKFELKQHDRVTVVRDEAKGLDASEQDRLNAADVKHLETDTSFLPLFELEGLSADSKIKGILTTAAATSPAASPEGQTPKATAPQQGSFGNLKKLNEQLEEEHKKRSGN